MFKAFRKYYQISIVWMQRPLNWWMVAVLAVIALGGPGLGGKHYETSNGYPELSSPLAKHVIQNYEDFRQAIDRGEIDKTIEGMNLLFIQSSYLQDRQRDESNAWQPTVLPISEVEKAVSLFPNLRWLRIGSNHLSLVQTSALNDLSSLATIHIQAGSVSDADVKAVSRLKSIEFIQIDTLDLDGSLTHLASLPKLRTLVISKGPFMMTDTPRESPFRREVLIDIQRLKSLEQLVLHPQWLPGIGYFAGSTTPDMSCDSILKKNAAELLAGHPSLRHLWIGSQQLPEERSGLRDVAKRLPGVNVHAAWFDLQKIKMSDAVLSFLGLIFVGIGFNLTSQFSAPQAILVPGYQASHQIFSMAMFCLVAFVASVTIPLWTSISLSASITIVTYVLATSLLFHYCVMLLWQQGSRIASRAFLPFVAALYFYAFLGASQPSWGLLVDRFLLGDFPTIATSIAVTSVAVSFYCIRAFRNQHRVYAEASISAAIALDQIKQNGADFALKEKLALKDKKAAKHCFTQNRSWYRGLDNLRRQNAASLSWLQMNQLWQLGGNAFVSLVRFGLIYAVIALPLAISYSLINANDGGVLWGLGLMYSIASANAITLVDNYSRRKSHSFELLLPSKRSDFILHRFASTFFQIGISVLVSWAIAMTIKQLVFSPVTGVLIIRSTIMSLVVIGLLTGVSLIFVLLPVHQFNWFLNGIISLLIVGVGFFLAITSLALLVFIYFNGEFIPQLTDLEQAKSIAFASHPAIIPCTAIVASVVLAGAFRLWMREEFA
jgi:hypothetical protein